MPTKYYYGAFDKSLVTDLLKMPSNRTQKVIVW